MSKIAEIGDGIVQAVRAHVTGAVGALNDRLTALEAKLTAIPAGEKGDQGPQGEPGADGKDGRDADMPALQAFIKAEIQSAMATVPPGRDGRDGPQGVAGRDGKDGTPGADGFSLDDFTASMSDDGRTLTLAFVRGDVRREHTLKVSAMIYRGIWQEGAFERGDVVTYGGSAWHAQTETTEKPGNGCPDWKLMVKEGRPGKDGNPPAPAAHTVVRTK